MTDRVLIRLPYLVNAFHITLRCTCSHLIHSDLVTQYYWLTGSTLIDPNLACILPRTNKESCIDPNIFT